MEKRRHIIVIFCFVLTTVFSGWGSSVSHWFVFSICD